VVSGDKCSNETSRIFEVPVIAETTPPPAPPQSEVFPEPSKFFPKPQRDIGPIPALDIDVKRLPDKVF